MGNWIEHRAKWIKTTDKMPEHLECVLVAIEGGAVIYAEVCHGDFHDPTGDEYRRISRVTHWMELPQRPQRPEELDE